MALMYKRVQRVWNLHPASYPLRSIGAGVRGWLGGPKPLRMLLVSDGSAYTSEQQFAPIRRHAAQLGQRFGLVLQHRGLANALAMSSRSLSRFDIVGLKLGFKTQATEAERVTSHFTQALAGKEQRLVYFDGDDDLNVQWHGVMAAVDLYVKKHVFATESAYQASYIGKSNLTDLVARRHGVSFAEDIIPRSGGLPPQALTKLHLGWNIALDDKLFELSRHMNICTAGFRAASGRCRIRRVTSTSHAAPTSSRRSGRTRCAAACWNGWRRCPGAFAFLPRATGLRRTSTTMKCCAAGSA